MDKISKVKNMPVNAIKGYKNLIVWQKSMDLVADIYVLVKGFPKEEMYGLTSQIKRSAVSIPSNIAEGSRKLGIKDRRNFFNIAFGSGAELETQLEIAKRNNFCSGTLFDAISSRLDEVMRILNTLIFPRG